MSEEQERPTWFRTGSWSARIEPVDVVKVTDKMVTVRAKSFYIGTGPETFYERRYAKQSDHDCYFPTWDEAHQHLIAKAEAALMVARRRLEVAQSELGNIKGLKRPEPKEAA